MKEYALNAELRTETGKNACNRIREKGFVPAVMYSPGNSEKIMVNKKDFYGLFHGHISESVLIDLNIPGMDEKEKPKVFVKDYLVDPVTNDLLHIDLYKITAGQKIKTVVAIEITGTPAGTKIGGVLEIMERELEIECLPTEMPEKVVVDVSALQIGDTIHIGDLQLAEGIKLLSSADRVIASVLAPHIVKEEEEAAEAGAEGEEKKAEAGEGEASKESAKSGE